MVDAADIVATEDNGDGTWMHHWGLHAPARPSRCCFRPHQRNCRRTPISSRCDAPGF
jgi:hypothetical protein